MLSCSNGAEPVRNTSLDSEEERLPFGVAGGGGQVMHIYDVYYSPFYSELQTQDPLPPDDCHVGRTCDTYADSFSKTQGEADDS